jgi:hypothetical protein
MKIETSSGRYAFVVEGNVSKAKTDEVLQAGIANVLYRAIFPAVRKITGASGKLEAQSFNADLASKAQAAIAEGLKDLGDFTITASEYVPSEGGGKPSKGDLEASEANVKDDARWDKFEAALEERNMEVPARDGDINAVAIARRTLRLAIEREAAEKRGF